MKCEDGIMRRVGSLWQSSKNGEGGMMGCGNVSGDDWIDILVKSCSLPPPLPLVVARHLDFYQVYMLNLGYRLARRCTL